jgi:hypothetical protein
MVVQQRYKETDKSIKTKGLKSYLKKEVAFLFLKINVQRSKLSVIYNRGVQQKNRETLYKKLCPNTGKYRNIYWEIKTF